MQLFLVPIKQLSANAAVALESKAPGLAPSHEMLSLSRAFSVSTLLEHTEVCSASTESSPSDINNSVPFQPIVQSFPT